EGRLVSDDRDDAWRQVVSQPLDIEEFHPRSSGVALEMAAASLCGRVYPHNTDHYLAIRLGRQQATLLTSLAEADLPPRFEEYAYALLVADGWDTDGTGGRASRFALSTLAHLAIRYGKWNVRVGPESASDFAAQSEFLYRQLTDAVIQA